MSLPKETLTRERPARSYHSVDYHVAGEPFRVVIKGSPDIPGDTITAKRLVARESASIDSYRRLACLEPRGHADMYGGFVYAPDRPDSDLSVMFWHTEGYPPSCAHGTMAMGVWAVESGHVDSDPDGVTTVTMDVPAGRTVAHVYQNGGRVTGVRLQPMVAYPVELDVMVGTSRGEVPVDLAFGGAVFASVSAKSLGLEVVPEQYRELIAIGREIRRRLNDKELTPHPEDPRLTGVFGVLIYDDLGDTESGVHERNINVFNDGWVDRSPCAPGTSTRLALLTASGRLKPGAELLHESIVGTRYRAWGHPADSEIPDALIVEIDGMVYRTGEHFLTLDANDPLASGFLLRSGPAGSAVETLRL